MKQVFFLLLIIALPVINKAQVPDTAVRINKDTIRANYNDSSKTKNDSTADKLNFIAKPQVKNDYKSWENKLYKQHIFLSTIGKPVAMINRLKRSETKDILFYFILTVVSLLAFFRFFYTKYFNSLFRVFFNTTLRQSQLTDQLLQAKLASLLFNFLFVVAAGLYAYFLLLHFNWINEQRIWVFIFSSIAGMTSIYFVKYITLKFTGWLTGNEDVLNTYIFIIFLINKIIGIILIPVIIVLAFSEWLVKDIAVILSLLIIGLMFLLRFFRSYGLLQHQIKVSRFHFFLYIIGIEILPLALLYKGLVVLLGKNL